VKSIKIVASFAFLAFVLALNSAAFASAVTVQWFPVAGTNADYQISQGLFYNNNTSTQTSTYNVFNDTSTGYIYLVPSFVHLKPLSTWNTLKNNTGVTWRNSYTAASATTLNRTPELLVGNATYTAAQVLICLNPAPSIYLRQIYSVTLTLPKNGFYSAWYEHQYPDYINYTAAIGDQVAYDYTMESNDGSQMTAISTYTSTTWNYTISLYADETGRVTRAVYSDFAPAYYEPSQVYATFIIFSSGSQSSSIEGYPAYIIFAVIGAVALVIGFLISFRGRKQS
jgi:hypothetical protein